MRHIQTEKALGRNLKRNMTFYKNFRLKTVEKPPRIKSTPKLILVERSPWNTNITTTEINNLLRRLNDTPDTLYQAFQRKQQAAQQQPNRNKFILLQRDRPGQFEDRPKLSSSLHRSMQLQNKAQEGIKQIHMQQKILKRIQATKKKYIEEYRRMLLGMKAINLDTDLPRIKYVEQNEMSEVINDMHSNTKLKLIR